MIELLSATKALLYPSAMFSSTMILEIRDGERNSEHEKEDGDRNVQYEPQRLPAAAVGDCHRQHYTTTADAPTQ
ncbi:hypothetical protein Y032_0948g3171 [Ancylostoma ceylanicum]|uniref:Uncharacterized protein n=1 Tax=Ancylostoma ceylanicum TaxID=53326 RepID=A0A016W9Q5_9BILA|nr:hypothetical protein Y032_0948g3171 [Ancylostoma ceylanicum]